MTTSLHQLFNPSSIAVLGASRESTKVGNIVVSNLQKSGFRGTIYPINQNSTEINNLPAYPDLQSLPQKVDLVVVSIPSQYVLENIIKANELGYKNFVVFSAGFKEIGQEGRLLEDNLIKYAKDNNLNILGPNCLGFYNLDCSANITFGTTAGLPGNLRFVSQSGAIVTALFDYATHHNLGFRDCLTLGNKAVLNENDILNYYLETSRQGDVVGLYLESITDGRIFLDLCQQLTEKKIPVFILKPGRHSSSQKAMLSHTGSMAGEDSILDVALSEAGVLRINGFEELFDLSRAFSWLGKPSSNTVAIVSNAGGPAVVSSDMVVDYGLELAQLSPQTEQVLSQSLPRFAGIHNPVDVLGDAQSDRYRLALDAVLNEPNVSSVLVLLTPQTMTDIENIANVISDMSIKYTKPIVASFIGGDVTQQGAKILDQKHIPCYNYPERAIRALSRVYFQTQNQPIPLSELTNTHQKLETTEVGLLGFSQAQALLSKHGITPPAFKIISSVPDLENYIQEHGYPLVLKATGPSLVHKTEHKAVYINLITFSQVTEAYEKLKTLQGQYENTQIIAQSQVKTGLELIFGIKRDPTFGPVAMFGAGGKWVELLHDRNLALLPLNLQKATSLISTSKLNKIFSGYRGEEGYPVDKLAQVLVSLSDIFLSFSNISELEINPIILTHNDAWCVDFRLIISQI